MQTVRHVLMISITPLGAPAAADDQIKTVLPK
jgi:hypothetical protein